LQGSNRCLLSFMPGSEKHLMYTMRHSPCTWETVHFVHANCCAHSTTSCCHQAQQTRSSAQHAIFLYHTTAEHDNRTSCEATPRSQRNKPYTVGACDMLLPRPTH
jgi:hypothetical protein